MRRNIAGQKIGAQLISTTDGSAFTGSVVVRVTIDAGTQTIGSVGSGVCTHEGNGFHTYAPSQAETNGDHLAFTFTGAGAIPVTVQLYTYVSQDSAAIKVKTDSLTFTVAGNVDSNIQRVNDVTVTGTGAPGNEWGP